MLQNKIMHQNWCLDNKVYPNVYQCNEYTSPIPKVYPVTDINSLFCPCKTKFQFTKKIATKKILETCKCKSRRDRAVIYFYHGKIQ